MSDASSIHARLLRVGDYLAICDLMRKAYHFDNVWSQAQFELLLKKFPEGQIGVEVDGALAGAALAIVVNYEALGDRHSYPDVHGHGTFSTHSPQGDTLYGLDIVVDPERRGIRLGRRLYEARKQLCENLNLRAIVAGGRIPGYAAKQDSLSPKAYIQKVAAREIYDEVLTFQLNNGFHVRKVLQGYLPYDSESKAFATLIEWLNVEHRPKSERLALGRKRVARIGALQWQMRPLQGLSQLLEQVEFFVSAASGYKADFLCLPEFFSAPLMAAYEDKREREAIRRLAGGWDAYQEALRGIARRYDINIIAGSAPRVVADRLRNSALLCRRDGSFEIQDKIHPTPDERSAWGLDGGDRLRVFDTDAGRIGMLICYDVEFPELSRVLAEQGMDILFVPFQTDTRTSYTRVLRCAQARAIENECYVVLSGSVGNLPGVKNMDIQYSRSAIYSPADHAFPDQGVVRESTPGVEALLMGDVDLDLLRHLHERGSVTNLKDRRLDLYTLTWNGER